MQKSSVHTCFLMLVIFQALCTLLSFKTYNAFYYCIYGKTVFKYVNTTKNVYLSTVNIICCCFCSFLK